MKKIKITAMRKACYSDLMEKYENPIEHACDIQEGQVWVANGWRKPDGMCDSAWESMSAFVMTLAHGGGDFYDGWMKNPKSAMISCNDGFRPVSFYIEALDEDAEQARPLKGGERIGCGSFEVTTRCSCKSGSRLHRANGCCQLTTPFSPQNKNKE